ncbi:MAG: hypothetical protein ACREAU_00725 [Nitrosopumilaceae archaeon]
MALIVYSDSAPGAPTLSAVAGAMLDVLDAALIVNSVLTTADDTTFTDRSVEARLEGGTAFDLIPTPAAGDRIYIGMSSTFSRTKYDLATLGVGGTYVWEYWNGSTWTTLSVTDGTSGFTADGTVTWTIPGTWATTLVGGANIVNAVFAAPSADTPFTDRTTEARSEGGTPFNLLVNFVAINDRLYIGMPAPFSRVQFDLATLGVGGTYVWEYGTAAGSPGTYSTLTVTDNTNGFTQDGTVQFGAPANWVTTTVNGVTQFWVRVRDSVLPTTNPTVNFVSVLGPLYWARVRASVNPSTKPTVNFLTVGGWTRAFSGTNTASYRQGSLSNGMLLAVDDPAQAAAATSNVRVRGFETMTAAGVAVANGTGPFPTDSQASGGLFWNKANSIATTSAAGRPYNIACSEKLVIFHVSSNLLTAIDAFVGVFGDSKTYKVGDAYNTLIIGGIGGTVITNNELHNIVINVSTATAAGHYVARAYTQIGSSLSFAKHVDANKQGSTTTMGGVGGMTYPNPVDGGLYLSPVFLQETASAVRGELPGVWVPLHNKPLEHRDTFVGTGTLAGRTFMALKMTAAAEMFLEISDTWNT